MEKIVIVDSGVPEGANNMIFDRKVARAISHTLLPWCQIYDEARKEGVTLITPDVFLKSPQDFKGMEVLLISHLVHPHTKKLINMGVKPLLLTCQESPFIATRFYISLPKYSSWFTHSMLFPGMQKRASHKTNFIPMYFPEFFNPMNETEKVPFVEKKFLTYIASNKETKDIVKTIIIKLLYGLDVQLIYSFRRKAIEFFSKRKDFDLYGRGWDSEDLPYIRKVYKGPVEDKNNILRAYKFALCLENASFPGYVTEKIFDCFFAGTVPVYRGAPDIISYIPANTFINVNDFRSLGDLECFLDSIDEKIYADYLENIQAFLRSEDYAKFSHQRFAGTVMNLIKSY